MSFDNLGLMPELLRAVRDQGYETPTPVQEQAIPLILAGRDLLAGASEHHAAEFFVFDQPLAVEALHRH